MTREQLSRKGRLTEKERYVRNKEILRLTATGLYNCTQIAEQYNRSARLIGRIRADYREPVNPWMTFSECAKFLGVSSSVIVALTDKMYIQASTFEHEHSPGVTLNGMPIYLAVRKEWLFKHEDRWGSASDAAAKAGISRKGMERRGQQDRAAYLEAPKGNTFTVNGQKGLRYIYDLEQIDSETSEERQLEMPLESKSKRVQNEGAKRKSNRGSIIRAHYSSDLLESRAETITCDKELDITMYHTQGKCSKATRFHIGWDENEGQPKIDILTRSPVTVRTPKR